MFRRGESGGMLFLAPRLVSESRVALRRPARKPVSSRARQASRRRWLPLRDYLELQQIIMKYLDKAISTAKTNFIKWFTWFYYQSIHGIT
jgi:hypothetical protein